jgi:hypothetical protein
MTKLPGVEAGKNTSAVVGVVSFTFWPLYPRGKRPRYPLDRRLGGPQNRSERRGEEKNFARN